MRVLCPMNTPMEITAPVSTITPYTISERAPMKQLSSMMVGVACSGSSTPPMRAPPYRGRRHHAHPGRREMPLVPGRELERHLVVELNGPGARRRVLHDAEG